MRNTWTIAIEFARQQKVMLVIFAFWIVGFDAAFAVTHRGPDISDFGALFTQQCVYGVVFAVFLASAVLRNERNSRRILAVMSKGITRSEYLAGHILGITLLAIIYFLAAGILFHIIGRSFGFPADVTQIVLAGILAALLATTVTLVFASWLHPLFAAALTIFLLSAPMLVVGNSEVLVISPVAYFIRETFSFERAQGWTGHGSYWLIAALETAVAWLIASLIFKRQDVAVPTE